jgi:hypothetical protein
MYVAYRGLDLQINVNHWYERLYSNYAIHNDLIRIHVYRAPDMYTYLWVKLYVLL